MRAGKVHLNERQGTAAACIVRDPENMKGGTFRAALLKNSCARGNYTTYIYGFVLPSIVGSGAGTSCWRAGKCSRAQQGCAQPLDQLRLLRILPHGIPSHCGDRHAAPQGRQPGVERGAQGRKQLLQPGRRLLCSEWEAAATAGAREGPISSS